MDESTQAAMMNRTSHAKHLPVPRHETYTHEHSERVVQGQSQRTAETEAACLLPHLCPGMRLLDFGCGPGSITLGLAAAVAPGEVVGIDIEPSVIEQARAVAAERSITNVHFEVGSVYALPFPDASFDAAFSRSVLEHLARPLEALREVRRVLTPGGVLGVRDCDWGGYVVAPPSPLVEDALALYLRVWERNGGNPRRGREHKALLRAAGFSRIEVSTGADVRGTPEATRGFADLCAYLLRRPTFVEQVSELGWTDPQQLEEMAAAFQVWGEHPDAFTATLLCQAIGWAD